MADEKNPEAPEDTPEKKAPPTKGEKAPPTKAEQRAATMEEQAPPAKEKKAPPTKAEQTAATMEEQAPPTKAEQAPPTKEEQAAPSADEQAAPIKEEHAAPSAEEQPPATPEEPAAVEDAPALTEDAPAPVVAGDAGVQSATDQAEKPGAREKPAVPGAHLEVDIVPEGMDPLGRDQLADPYAIDEEEPQAAEEVEEEEPPLAEPIATAAIDLAAGARYRATGKRKTAIARVILRPGKGVYLVNGHTLEEHFPRMTLQRNIRQPLETVGYQERMDVVARLQGGGISAQAGALRHGVSRALLEADPNLRGELKRRGFLTRDSRAKERKKAGLKKARKRPQFSKR